MESRSEKLLFFSQEPYRFLALKGSEDLIVAAQHKGLLLKLGSSIPGILKNALDTREPTVVASCLRLVQKMLTVNPQVNTLKFLPSVAPSLISLLVIVLTVIFKSKVKTLTSCKNRKALLWVQEHYLGSGPRYLTAKGSNLESARKCWDISTVLYVMPRLGVNNFSFVVVLGIQMSSKFIPHLKQWAQVLVLFLNKPIKVVDSTHTGDPVL